MLEFLTTAIACVAVYPAMALGAFSRLVWFGIELGWQQATNRIEARVFRRIAATWGHA